MSRLAEPVKVEFYSGSKQEETPRAFWVRGERVEVARVVGEHLEETHPERLRRRRLEVETAKGQRWVLTYDEATRTWWLEEVGR